MSGEKVKRFMAVAQPPRAVGGFEDEAVFFEEGEQRVVRWIFARREGDGEKVFAAVDAELGAGGTLDDARRGERGGAGERSRRC